MYKYIKHISSCFLLSTLVFVSCTNPAKENTTIKPIPNSSAKPNQVFNFDKFDSSKTKTNNSFKIKTLPNSQYDEMVTDYNWTWVDSSGNIRTSVVSENLLNYVRIPQTQYSEFSFGMKPEPIWSELNDSSSPYPGTAKCGNCSIIFNRRFGLNSASDILSMSVIVQADDSLKVFINNTFVEQVNYNEVKTVNIPLSLLKDGFNVLSLQGYNGAIVSPWEAYNYAGVAAKVMFQIKEGANYPSRCGDVFYSNYQKQDINLTYAKFNTKTIELPPDPCQEQNNGNDNSPYITSTEYYPHGRNVNYNAYTFGVKAPSCQ